VQPVQGLNPGAQFPGQPNPTGLPGGIQTGVPPGFRVDTNGQLVPNTPVPGQPTGAPGQPFSPTPNPTGLSAQFPNPNDPQPANQANQQFQNQQFQNQPGGPPGSPNAALNVINQLLTNPRQTTTTTQGTAFGGNQVGGIAGVASTHKGPSIKVYKD